MKIQLNTILLILLLAAIIVLLGQQSCIHKMQQQLKEKCPGETHIDTAKAKSKYSTGWYQPQPEMAVLEGGNIAASNEQPTKENYKFKGAIISMKDCCLFTIGSDTVFTPSDSGYVLFNNSEIALRDYVTGNPKFYYSDTQKTKYGRIIIQDTTEGRILARNVITDLDVPVVTKTITLKEPARVRGYLSLIAHGDQKNYLQAAGGGFMLQFKNYNALEADAIYNFKTLYPGQPALNYQLSYKALLSFRKN